MTTETQYTVIEGRLHWRKVEGGRWEVVSREAQLDLVRKAKLYDEDLEQINLVFQECEFLIDRVWGLEETLVDSDTARDYYGHVLPSLQRSKVAIQKYAELKGGDK